jgi:hypothetical protein
MTSPSLSLDPEQKKGEKDLCSFFCTMPRISVRVELRILSLHYYCAKVWNVGLHVILTQFCLL